MGVKQRENATILTSTAKAKNRAVQAKPGTRGGDTIVRTGGGHPSPANAAFALAAAEIDRHMPTDMRDRFDYLELLREKIQCAVISMTDPV